MSYKIEQVGYEMYGFKLGQMTKQGRIIGFAKSGSDRIGVECESSTYKTHESVFMEYLLDGYEGVGVKWLEEKALNQPKISIRHEIWNTTLIVQTLYCAPFEPVEKDGFELVYKDSTILYKSYADIGCKEGSCNLDTFHFDTQVEAQSYLDTLLELVEMVNNPVPVVNLSKDYSNCKLESGLYIYVGDKNVDIRNKNDTDMVSWNKLIVEKPIIKSQLEQILTHLGVKCEVRI